jgi:hypothetical protein
MSSIDFTSFLEAYGNLTGIVDGISIVVVVVVVLTHVRGTASSGITTIFALCSFSLINFPTQPPSLLFVHSSP